MAQTPNTACALAVSCEWSTGPAPAPEVVELPVTAFLDGLGMNGADHATTRHYMLFAGAGSGGHGGLSDLLGLYDDEEVAKEAFRSTRLSPAYRRGWAELVLFQPERGMEPVCWFGRARSEPVPRRVRPPRRHSVGLSRRRSADIP